MTVTRTDIPEVFILEPKVFGDSRGFFFESFNERDFEAATGARPHFVQDNHSRSAKGVLRGLHYQLQNPQGKLVRVAHGEVFDVAVDIRRSSPTFKKWTAVRLSADNKKQIWIPPGFAHGFLVLSDYADFLYKTTSYYHQPSDRALLWSDADIGIQWPLEELHGIPPSLSQKDLSARTLEHAELFA